MANYYVLLTDHGKSFIANAQANSQLALTHVVLGDANDQPYLPESRLNQTKLVHQTAKLPVASVKVINETTAEVSAVVPSNVGGFNVHEIGITDSSGKLVYVGNFHGGYRPTLTEGAGGDMELVITITADNLATVVIEMDGNVVSATRDWVNERFQLLLRTLIPYGYLYHTHTAVNPKPLFDELLGTDTQWRRIEGQTIVATDPDDTYISDIGIVLGQKGMTNLANAQRPNVYPLRTTHIFERYDPSTVVETVWKVVANKTSINEGDAVRFTITANNLPDGQILNWTIKEGALNSASNDVASPEKTDSGTVILKNGQAVVDFTTTPDDHEEEAQKHVRLTVGAPANLSINVPITDAGYNETAIHITQSTNEGIDLAEYYKQQSGSYPTAADNVRFIVDSGVDIVAPDTNTPALVNGSNWPTGNTPIVENRGRILGHGGNGGNGAAMMRSDSYTRTALIPDTSVPKKFNATAGTNGGTAIKGNILVENYNVIAGGGGGGGGSGAYLAGFIGNPSAEHAADIYHTSVDSAGNGVNGYAGSGIGAGGAPFGDSGLATLGFDWIKKTYPDIASNVDALLAGIQQIETDKGREVDNLFIGNGDTTTQRANLVNPYNDTSTNENLKYLGSDITAIRDKFGLNYNRVFSYIKSITAPYPENYNPKYETERYRYYLSQRVVGAPWIALAQPVKASLTSKGLGGALSIDVLNSTGMSFPSGGWRNADGGWVLTTEALSYVRGGNGGDYGENGEDGRLDRISYGAGSSVKTINLPINFETHIEILPPASGGLAGYIKEGNVTITNYSGGITKGR